MRKSNSPTRVPRYVNYQHIESYFGKKQPQAKIPTASLFSQLHFKNVFSDDLFHGGHLDGGHLVMRSAKLAIYLKRN